MKSAIVVILFAVVVLVFFHDVLLGDRVLITSNPARVEPWSHYAEGDDLSGKDYRTDAFYTYLPRQVELTRSVREGRVPLWNPYVFCGMPFYADPQSRVLYPISLLLVLADPQKAMGYDVAIHFLIAMAGMYLFLRIVRTGTPGAMAGALLYGFSSFFFLRMGHPTFVATASYIPFLFYAYEKARSSERTGTVLLIVFLVMGYLSGFPQVLFFGVMALMVHAARDVIEDVLSGRPDRGLRVLRVVAVSGVLSAAVAAVHLIPFVEFMRNCVGLGFDFEVLKSRHIWEPVFMLRSLYPDFFGNPVLGTNWLPLVKQGIHHYNTGFMVYCGAGSIVLLVTALPLARTSRVVRSLLIILALAVGLAVSAPFLRAAARVLPLLTFSQIDRIAAVACFGLAALSGVAFSRIVSGEYVRHRKYFRAAGIPLLIAVLAAGVGFHIAGDGIISDLVEKAQTMEAAKWLRPGSTSLGQWVGGGEDEWFAYEKGLVTRGMVLFSLAWLFVFLLTMAGRIGGKARWVIGLLFFLCLAADVMNSAGTYYVSQPSRLIAETDGIAFLRRAQGENGMWRSASLTPYRGALPVNTGQIFGIYFVGGRATIVPEAFADLVAAYTPAGRSGGGIPAVRDAQDIACARFKTSDEIIPGTQYRIVHDSDMIVYENTSALSKGFCVPAERARRVAAEDGEIVMVKQYMEDAGGGPCGSVSIVSYEPEAVEMEVSAVSDCFLVFQDTYYPGWEADVDGERTTVYRTDMGFRAVAVGRGEHEVAMRFRPGGLGIGLMITCAGIALSVIYGIKAKTRRQA